MHLEIRRQGKRKKYYLAHSFRDNGKVRKVRRYLGQDLSAKEIEKLRKAAEEAIRKQIEIYKTIRDPLKTVLSSSELKQIETLVAKDDIIIRHLTEKDWLTFTELFTYDTNAIEGSTVTQSEVKNILEKNQWPEERSKAEISETYGVAEAVEYIRRIKEHVSLALIQRLHNIVFKNSKPFAGRFRERGIEVAVVDSSGNIMHRGAPQRRILILLKELIEWYKKNKDNYHPLILATVVHNQFENIHPFQDGNGRVGRLLLNNILLKHNMPPVNIQLKNRKEYYHTLQEYEKRGNIKPTIQLILKEYRRLKKTFKK